MHDVAETLDVHQLHDLDAAGQADLAQVVARQVDEHDVLATLLWIGEQFLGKALILFRGGAARTGTGDREGHRMPVVDLDQRLGAGTNHVEIASLGVGERHEIHVRTGVERAQHTVHVERVSWRIQIQTLGYHRLEHIAVDDVPLRLLHPALILGLGGAEPQLGLGQASVKHAHAGLPRHRRGGLALHGIQPFDGLVIRGIGAGRPVVDVHRIGYQPHRAGHMVDHCDVGGQGQRHLRLAGLIRRRGAQFGLPMADGIPADGADQSAGQVRQSGHMRRLEHLERGMGHLNHVTLSGHSGRHLAEPVRLAVIGAQLSYRIDADEAVSAPGTAVFRRFQNERSRTAPGETLVKAHGRQRIGEQSPHDGNHTVSGVGKPMELGAVRPCAAPFEMLDTARGPIIVQAAGHTGIVNTPLAHHAFSCSAVRSPTTTGNGPPSSKHERLPVWQAAPTWST